MASDDLNSDSGILPEDEPKQPDLSQVLPAETVIFEPSLPEVLPAPKPPHPNFWWSLLWSFGILVSTNGTVVTALIVILVGGEMMSRLQGEKKPADVGIASPRHDEEEERQAQQQNTEEVRAERRARLEASIFEKLAIPVLLAEIFQRTVADPRQ